MSKEFITVDGVHVELNGEKNLLEVVRKAGIDLPTFCYHSELSVFGACRMCVCEVEGRGLQATCSTPPSNGMVIKTNTDKTMRIRRMALELLLSNHCGDCPSCSKNGNCRLQTLAQRLGVTKVRFPKPQFSHEIDDQSASLVRDSGKCILCGDCVRMCKEVQGIGVLDFVGRGWDAKISTAFGKSLADVECVLCGQCATCCPTGAITVKSEIDKAWKAIYDTKKTVVVQVAPAVRAALADHYGVQSGELAMGKLVAALRRLGFDRIYDTSFAADLTTVEEGTEFLGRLASGERLPQFTSCCPAWVKYAEQFHPSLLNNLSSCKSPQQMFSSLAKKHLPETLGVEAENMVVISIMPCTAKKFEAARPEFAENGVPDTDIVLTSQEVIRMMDEGGIQFNELAPESLDMPFGIKTGAGVIFGATGGVAEAVLRLATLGADRTSRKIEFHEVRGMEGIREAEVMVGDKNVRLAVVNGLANAKELVAKVESGESSYDIIEVMSCRGGCIGGAGQPLPNDMAARERRRKLIYECDSLQNLRNAADNPYVQEAYTKWLQSPNSHVAHELLHTAYRHRRRLSGQVIDVQESTNVDAQKVCIKVCVGTGCYTKGAYNTLHKLMARAEKKGYTDRLEIKASFCFENCGGGPSVEVDGNLHSDVTPDSVDKFLKEVVEPKLGLGKQLVNH
ncbi:MAG: [FeFe] hydrogenase, group A [Capsulimonadaceae bacterium]|nr:[FeFe] hydrogenase, group A [Capsulimonadaceae bacterium]